MLHNTKTRIRDTEAIVPAIRLHFHAYEVVVRAAVLVVEKVLLRLVQQQAVLFLAARWLVGVACVVERRDA